MPDESVEQPPLNQWVLTITAEAEVIPGEPKEDDR